MVKDLGCARWIRWLGSEFFLMVFFFLWRRQRSCVGFFLSSPPLPCVIVWMVIDEEKIAWRVEKIYRGEVWGFG